MTQQNTMPDIIWADSDGDWFLSENRGCAEHRTKYFRAEPAEDEMAQVKGNIVKIKCEISSIKIILKRAQDKLCELAADMEDEHAFNIINAIDRVLERN